MASANATFCDFLVRGVNLDAKDILTGKSDPYIVIKIPIRDPRTLAPPIVPVDNKRLSDPTSSSSKKSDNKNTLGSATREEIENELTSAAAEYVSNTGTYVNAQGTYQAVKGQLGSHAGSMVQETTATLVSGVVAVAMLGSAVYHYTRKTHPQTPGFVQIYESDVAGNTLNPHWQPFRLGLYELCRGNLNLEVLIECYDWDRFKPSDFIGAISLPVRTLLNGKEELKLQLLNARRITSGLLYIQSKPSVPKISHCDFNASASGLSKKDLFGLSDPYFVIKVPQNIAEHPSLYNTSFAGHITIPSTTVACGIQNHKILKGYGEVFESFVVRKSLNPDWGTFRIGFYELCRGELDVNILIQCFDYNRILPSKFIGSAQVSVRSIVESGDTIALPLVSKKGKMAGTFYIQCTPSSPIPQQPTQQQQLLQEPQQQEQQQQQQQLKPPVQTFVRGHTPLNYTPSKNFQPVSNIYSPTPTNNDMDLEHYEDPNPESYVASDSPVLPPYSSPALASPYYEAPTYEDTSSYPSRVSYEYESYDPESYYEEASETYDPQSYSEEPQSYSFPSLSYPSHPSCAYDAPAYSEVSENYTYEDTDSNSVAVESFDVPEIRVEPPVVTRPFRRQITRVPSFPPPVCPLTPETRKASVSSPAIPSSVAPAAPSAPSTPIISSSSLSVFNAPPRRKPPPPPKSNSPSSLSPSTPSTSSTSFIPSTSVAPSKPAPQVGPPKRVPPPPPRSVANTNPPSSSNNVPTPSKQVPPRPQRIHLPSSTPSSSSSSSSSSSKPFSYKPPPQAVTASIPLSMRPQMKIVNSCPQIDRRPPLNYPAHCYVPSPAAR